ncbi:signal peptidase II [Novosphingobium sp. 1949]|uniref:Lipoprotein signal peptidase n=1 Tax=Novosphingobium organovorum TaxID=2930092 RepID=A0ABT0BCY6_9SPHN|nr:signal peptidase II [Novosphingobium organovorum]MCJ2182858.1 signal peptidase II [Novosphingobium organovorum]
MSLTRKRLLGLLVAALVFLIDQAVKAWVTGPLGLDRVGDVKEIVPIFALRFTQNFGVSLGMFTAGSAEGRLALVAMTGAIALFVFVWMLRERKMLEIAALGFVLGGAIGNIRDRINFGYVVDYADLHFGEWRPFLVFNLADAAITLGVLIILARSLLSRDKPETTASPAPES